MELRLLGIAMISLDKHFDRLRPLYFFLLDQNLNECF